MVRESTPTNTADSSVPTPIPGLREVCEPSPKEEPFEYQPPVEKVCPTCDMKHMEFRCPHCRLEDFI